MKVFTIKKEFRTELKEAIDLFEVKSEFTVFDTNFFSVFKFKNINEEDEITMFKLIDNIISR
jgi:hypothetical protein